MTATGNSFATPCISGIAALVLSKHPGLTPFQLKTVLYLTSANVGGEGMTETVRGGGRGRRARRPRSSSRGCCGRSSRSRARSSAAKASSIFLFDEETDELVFAAVAGEDEQHLVGRRMPSSTGIAGWVLSSRTPLVIDDVQNDPRFARDVAERTGTCRRE